MIIVLDQKLFKYQTSLSENIYLDQNGYLVCEGAILGRTGKQQYAPRELGLSGTELIDVYRYEEEIFSPESMASLEGRPLTLNHPRELVTIDNHNQYAKGEVYNIRREGDNLVGDIRVFDKKVIDIILNKKMRELSLGYTMELEYDESKNIYFVKDIVYNHIALVKKGRAGNARINDSIEIIDENEGEKEMEKQNNGKIELTNEQLADLIKGAVNEAVKPLQEKLGTMETNVNERFTKMEQATKPIEVVAQKQQETQPVVEQPKVETNTINASEIANEVLKMLNAQKEQETKVVAKEETEPQVASFKIENQPEKEVDKDLEMNVYFSEFSKQPNETENEYTKRINSLTASGLKKKFEREMLNSQNN